MNKHQIQDALERANFTASGSAGKTAAGNLAGWGTTVGNGVEGWAPNAVFVDTNGSAVYRQYSNTGTKATAVWTAGNALLAAEFFNILGTAYVWFYDNAYLKFGTDNDIKMMWNGTYLEGGPSSGLWANAPSPADPQYHVHAHDFFDDFHTLDVTATTGLWTPFVVGTGTTAPADDVVGGGLVMTCQATTDDACEQIILKSAPFMLAAGKTIWYETRLKIVGDVQSEVSFGLASVGEDLTAVADVYPEDGISIANQDASLANALTCTKSGTDTGAVAAINTMATGTYVTYGLLIDGVTSVTPYINGTAGTAATATICDDQSLAPYFLVRNGDGTTQQILTVSYCKVVQLR